MDTYEEGEDSGAAMMYIKSPTRRMFVLDPSFSEAFWKIPCGHIKQGESALDAAIREANEETGIELRPEKVRLVSTHFRLNESCYFPHCFVADVSEDELDTRHEVTYEENGREMKTRIFTRAEIPMAFDSILEDHHWVIKEIEGF